MNVFDMTGVDRWNVMLAKPREIMTLADKAEWLSMLVAGMVDACNEDRWKPGERVRIHYKDHEADGRWAVVIEYIPVMMCRTYNGAVNLGPLYSLQLEYATSRLLLPPHKLSTT